MKKIVKKFVKKLGFDIISNYQIERNDVYFHKQKLLNNINVETVFDVGAATGEFIEKYKQMFPNAQIYAFEPRKDVFQYIKDHYKYCNSFNIALSDKIGESSFFITKNTASSSLYKPIIEGNAIEKHTSISEKINVKTDTIDNFCKLNKIKRINLLKMDVQGAELDILKGATFLLENKNIDLIYTEVEFGKIYTDQPLFHHIALFLEKYNYTLYNLYNSVYQDNSKLFWADALFIKN